MQIQQRLITALRDTSITSATAYHTLAYLAIHSDESGNIQSTPDGRSASDPNVIAEAIGASKPAVFEAFRRLERHGYLAWNRARGHERTTGVTGRVRILLSA